MTTLRQDLSPLVDAHVHCADADALATVLAAGVGAVRNAGTQLAALHGSCFRCLRPFLLSSCWALSKKGGYGARFGVAIESAAEIKAQVLRLKQAGAGIIKVMASGAVSLKQAGTITAGGFDGTELKVIVEEAASHGLAVMAHANGEKAISAAAEAGVRSIEHGFFMTARALELLADKGVFWVPTTGALVRAADAAGTALARQLASGLVQEHLAMVRQAHALAVPLAVGTDCVLPDAAYGQAYDAEMAYFRQAGLPEADVIRIATREGARLLGLDTPGVQGVR